MTVEQDTCSLIYNGLIDQLPQFVVVIKIKSTKLGEEDTDQFFLGVYIEVGIEGTSPIVNTHASQVIRRRQVIHHSEPISKAFTWGSEKIARMV